MNILFVLYGDLSSNSATPLALYAQQFAEHGHSCAVAIPSSLETISAHAEPAVRAVLYADVLNEPESIFPDGRAADVIHAWTPRENVRRFVTAYMAKRPTPLLVYLEDHELWISCRALGLDEESLAQQTERGVSKGLPDALSNPFFYRNFIGLADLAVVIQEKLRVDVPAWVSCETVMPGVNLDFFAPRAADSTLRQHYGVAENERVIVYPGGVNGFTRPGIKALCQAVVLINQQGYPCKLLRTGPFALDFMDELPPHAARAVVDLGVVPRGDLPDLLALADVFVQPGKIDPFEDLRLPGKLPEILAMGRPVLMPDVNIAHLFRDGVDAMLTHTGTAQEIAAKCIELFLDPQWAQVVGEAGRRFAEKNFDIRLQAIRMEAAYQKACANFDATIAAQVWQGAPQGDSVDLLLARKLIFLADSQRHRSSIEMPALLREHAQLVQSKRARVDGLELATAVRDAHIASLSLDLAERDTHITTLNQTVADKVAELEAVRQSASWRLTAPLRWLVHRLEKMFSSF